MKTVAEVLDTSWIAARLGKLPARERDAIEALRAVDDSDDDAVTAATIACALPRLRAVDADILTHVTTRLADGWPHALLEALLPNARFPPDVHVRMGRVRDGVIGDLAFMPSSETAAAASGSQVGVYAVVSSARGARALQALDRDIASGIVELSTHGPARTDPDVAAALAATDFPSVVELRLDEMPATHAAPLILRCPSLVTYRGPMSPDVADAIATTAMRELELGRADDDIFAHLARSSHLEELTLSSLTDRTQLTHAGFGALARLASLRVLRVTNCKLTDDDLRAIASATSIEALGAGLNSVGDAGGVALGALAKLRRLDLNNTKIGDATVRALAKLPALEALDLCDAREVTPEGLAALAAAPKLRFLGIAWDCDAAIDRAAKALANVEVVESDMYDGGAGALWERGFFKRLPISA